MLQAAELFLSLAMLLSTSGLSVAGVGAARGAKSGQRGHLHQQQCHQLHSHAGGTGFPALSHILPVKPGKHPVREKVGVAAVP